MQRWPKIAFTVGALAVVGAMLWALIAVPRLVRLPSSTNETYTYAGTLTTAADPATGRVLSPPAELPLTITRHVQTVRGATTLSTEVLAETVTFQAGPQTFTERHQYAIDRKSMRLRGGKDSWSFDPSNTVDRGGAYRLNFPIGTKGHATYRVWSNELGSSAAASTAAKATKVRGLRVFEITGTRSGDASPAYTAALKARGVPDTISISQIKSQLAILGFNADQLVADVTNGAGAAAGAAVIAGLNQSLPVHFTFEVTNGRSAVEPRTGQVVSTHIEQAIAARVDKPALAALKQSLTPLAGIPSVQRTMSILDVIATAPANPVISMRFDETPSSVASAVRDARHHVRQLQIVRQGIPLGLAALGVALGLLGLVGMRRTRRSPIDETAPAAVDVSDGAQDGELDLRARVPAPKATEQAGTTTPSA